MPTERRVGAAAILAMLAAITLLNFALGLHNRWPTPWITTRYELAVEAAALVLTLAALVHWRGQPGRWLRALLAALVVALVLGRYADVTAPALYGRPINLYWDARHLPGVMAMLARVASWWQLALLTLGVAALATLAWLGAARLVDLICRPLAATGVRAVSALASGAVIAFWLLSQTPVLAAYSPWFAQPVTLSWATQIKRLNVAMRARDRTDLHQDPLLDLAPNALGGANVLVMFIESYGACTFDRPGQAEALAATRRELADTARRSGRAVVSAMVESPTFGGGSWLAHASFLTGHKVSDQGEYDQLLASDRASLITRFNAQGYRTVGLLPGIRLAWPEGAYYGFEQIYDAAALQYPGPDFGWWRIPDQYALATAAARELTAPQTRPVLLFFTSITSHAPFTPVAPYIKDWSQLSSATPYGDPEQAAQNLPALQRQPDWSNLAPAYVESIGYALKTVTGFLERAAPETLLIVLGDHQPAASVTGPDARWAVPVHIIGRQQTLLNTLRETGFVDGLHPSAAPAQPMHTLTNLLLGALGKYAISPARHAD